ncbi:MAG TPA: ImmA/IrrE family metallo-endopeptidase [Candidatus Saccharimonadales bacterium]|nr:ImmA/IrrE family metallo-endopeptidase [Candidatus Saccharimonadales bacterium]
MSIRDAQEKAILVAAEYNPSGIVPFPFLATVNKIDELSIFYLDNMPDEVSGAIFFQDGEFSIAINKNKPVVRQNFTAAHEFGHYFLHRKWLVDNAQTGLVDYSNVLDSEGMLLRPDEAPKEADSIQKEREANNFAAVLLMPEDKVRQFWELTHDVNKCADAFEVSIVAMAIRLEKLGLV